VLVLLASQVGVVALLVFVLLFFSHRYYCLSRVVLLFFLCGVTTLPTWCCYFSHARVACSSCVAITIFCCTCVPCSSHVGVIVLLALVLCDIFTLVLPFFLHWCCFSSHMFKYLLAQPLLFLLHWCYSFFLN
jgi:hypothetical protein